MSAPQIHIDKGLVFIKTEAFTFNSDTPGMGLSRVNFDDGLMLETRHAFLGKMSESVAVHEKRHINASRDGQEVVVSMRSVIPFGAEPAVKRQIGITESALRFDTEIALRNSFALEHLSAESLTLSGPIAKIGFIKAPKKSAALPETEWTSFDSFEDVEMSTPPLSVIIETESGSVLELSHGEDIWRWMAATRHGGTFRFILRRDGKALRLEHNLFTLNPDTEPAKGWNWRLSWLAAWSRTAPAKSRKRKFKDVFDMEAFDWPDAAYCVVGGKQTKLPCPGSPAVLNSLKRWLRSNLATLADGDTLAIVNAEAAYCESASHQDRPKLESLPHWGLDPLIEFREWASKQLEPSGAKLLILPSAKSNASKLPSFAALSK